MDTTPPQSDFTWKGIYRARDVADAIQRDWQTGIPPGLPSKWAELNRFYLVKKKQWSVVTGIPSHGKSTWVDNLMIHFAELHGWKFLVISPENQPIERHVENLIEIYSGKKFLHPDQARVARWALTGDEMGLSTKFVDDHFRFVNPSETEFNIDYLCELGFQIKNDPDDPFEFDGMVIDPYNELESKRPSGFSETEYISSVLGKIRRFVKEVDCHLWFVAHPTKLRETPKKDETDPRASKIYAKPSMYDIAGAAHWYNKCDMGVVVYRNVDKNPESTTIDIQKIRYRECGAKGSVELYYDTVCNRFVETEGELLWNQSPNS